MTEMTTGCEVVGHPIRLTCVGEDVRCPCGMSTITWEMPGNIGRLGVQTIARVESASGMTVRLSGLPEALAAARGAL